MHLAESQELIEILNELKQNNTWVGIIKGVVIPIIVALIVFYVSNLNKEHRDRKRQSLVGAAILRSLLEEVKNGITSMEENKKHVALPCSSWEGMSTISEPILERLLSIRDVNYEGEFPVHEIRIHCKNYFEHIVFNFNQYKNSSDFDCSTMLSGAKGVEKMLDEGVKRLEKNAKSWWPK